MTRSRKCRNIVRCFEAFVDNETKRGDIIQEYMENGSLLDFMNKKTEKRCEPDECKYIIYSIT